MEKSEDDYSGIYTWKHRVIAVHGALLLSGYLIFNKIIPILINYGYIGSVSEFQFFISEFFSGTSALSIWSGYFGRDRYKDYVTKILNENGITLFFLWIIFSYISSFYSRSPLVHGVIVGYLVTFIWLFILKLKNRGVAV